MNENKTKSEKGQQILHNLIASAKLVQSHYGGRKELASEIDPKVVRLCDCIEEALTFGFRSGPSTLLQNVQEIVNLGGGGNSEYNFWSFCQRQLTAHERERFESLKNVWTKCGKAKAFLRSALNEKSLQRYILMFMEDEEIGSYFERWSLLLDPEAANLLPSIAAGLNPILFALTVDTPEFNVNSFKSVVQRDEPLIYAPSPVGPPKKVSAVERPIATIQEVQDFVSNPLPTKTLPIPTPKSHIPIENPIKSYEAKPEPPVFPVMSDFAEENNVEESAESSENEEIDNKSVSSSVYSKSSSSIRSVQQPDSKSLLEEKVRELTERCTFLETRVAELSLQNRQLLRLTNYSNKVPASSTCLITIPFAKLLKLGHKKHYTYEIHVTMLSTLEKWSISRRYREFHHLNEAVNPNNKFPNLHFPPKKRFGNMNAQFVEERRHLLQAYLRELMETLPQADGCTTMDDLQMTFPFFKD